LLDRIAKLQDKSQVAGPVASIHQVIRPANLNFISAQYPGVLFGIMPLPTSMTPANNLLRSDQSGTGMPAREFCLKDDDKSKQIRDLYLKHVVRILELSGESQPQATADAQIVLELETALANVAMDIAARRDPKNQNNKMSLQQLQALTPSFNWKAYFTAMHVPDSPAYRSLLLTCSAVWKSWRRPNLLSTGRAYLRYSTVNFTALLLSKPFVDENFDFYGKVISSSQEIQPRWRRCSAYADIELGEAVGQAYVARYFPPQNKARHPATAVFRCCAD